MYARTHNIQILHQFQLGNSIIRSYVRIYVLVRTTDVRLSGSACQSASQENNPVVLSGRMTPKHFSCGRSIAEQQWQSERDTIALLEVYVEKHQQQYKQYFPGV